MGLLDAGLSRSARRLLRNHLELRGPELNALRRQARARARAPEIRPMIHALLLDGDLGFVAPIWAKRSGNVIESAVNDATKQAATTAQLVAADHVRGYEPSKLGLGLFSLDGLAFDGASLGLAAVLAFVSRLTGRTPTLPVLASAVVNRSGSLSCVEGAEAKIAAAAVELEGTEGLVLMHPDDAGLDSSGSTIGARHVADALRLTFDDDDLELHPSLRSFQSLLHHIDEFTDHREAIRLLEAYNDEALLPADRAQYFAKLGSRYRHLGLTARAVDAHDQARALMESTSHVLGGTEIETIDMETLATDFDTFDFEEYESAFRERLAGRFHSIHNKVRCRGMLASTLVATRRPAEAIELLQANLLDQQASESLLAEVPRTLCYLSWAAACAKDSRLFDETAFKLLEATHSSDLMQFGYNDAALTRGSTRLGRYQEVVQWVRVEQRLWGHGPSPSLRALLSDSEPITAHPMITTARALVRAFRHTDHIHEALDIASCVSAQSKGGLVSWLSELVAVEAALCRLALDEKTNIETTLAEIRSRLEGHHEQASEFYGTLLDALSQRPLNQHAVRRIEDEIDWIFY